MPANTETTFLPILPRDLDLVDNEDGYAIYVGENPLKSPAGIELSHPDRRLVETVYREIMIRQGVDFSRPGGAVFLCALREHPEGQAPWDRSCPGAEATDPLLREPVPVKSCRAVSPEETLAFLEQNREVLPLSCTGAAAAVEARNKLRQLLAGKDQTLEAAFLELPRPARCGGAILAEYHGCGLGLALLLVSRRINASAYACALFGLQSPMKEGPGPACTPFFGAECPSGFLFSEGNPLPALGRVREEACLMVELLACFQDETQPRGSELASLIGQGESEHLEFKSTLRFNLYQKKNDPAIEHACLKTVAAFLNTDGGDLLVGVDDSGQPLGLDDDKFTNEDHMARHFWNLVKTSLGQDLAPYVRTRFLDFDSKRVLRVTCRKSPKPVFLCQKNLPEEFYVRIGPSSEKLGIQDALRYTAHRFPALPAS